MVGLNLVLWWCSDKGKIGKQVKNIRVINMVVMESIIFLLNYENKSVKAEFEMFLFAGCHCLVMQLPVKKIHIGNSITWP